jgi:hypothetical protein
MIDVHGIVWCVRGVVVLFTSLRRCCAAQDLRFMDPSFTTSLEYVQSNGAEGLELPPVHVSPTSTIVATDSNAREFVAAAVKERMTRGISWQLDAMTDGVWELLPKVPCCVLVLSPVLRYLGILTRHSVDASISCWDFHCALRALRSSFLTCLCLCVCVCVCVSLCTHRWRSRCLLPSSWRCCSAGRPTSTSTTGRSTPCTTICSHQALWSSGFGRQSGR